jgi:hypothetical protein
MVPLTPVPSEFAGRVLVAKLGSAGIIAEVRGASRVYPVVASTPIVWVEETEVGEARELITADTDDVLPAAPDDGTPRPSSLRPIMVAVALLVLASFVVGMHGCSSPATPPARHTPAQ